MEEIISQDLKMIQLGVETMGVENMQHDVFSLTEKIRQMALTFCTFSLWFVNFFGLVEKKTERKLAQAR